MDYSNSILQHFSAPGSHSTLRSRFPFHSPLPVPHSTLRFRFPFAPVSLKCYGWFGQQSVRMPLILITRRSGPKSVFNLFDSLQIIVDSPFSSCIMPRVEDGDVAQTSSSRKTSSDSILIVPASASSAADRAPRSRYLRAGTAFFSQPLFESFKKSDPLA